LAIIKGINIETSITTFILLTGGLAFAGSLLSGSKIYSALNAFLVIFEAKLRHVSMDDAVKVSKV
jgi:pheromone shutdown protein TraB